jgi:predicted RNase H-like HicB family nuclease
MTETTVRLPVTVEKRPGREAGYVATYGTYPREIEAGGATAAEARDNLTAALAVAIDTLRQARPQFARADDGALHVAVPDYDGGSRWYRVTDDKARLTTSSCHPTAEAFTTCVGMTVIPGN